MIEIGVVAETRAGRAGVRLNRNDSCRSCGLCLFSAKDRGMILEAENGIGAQTGDRVEVEIPRRDPLVAAALLFGLPLLALLAGAGAGYALAGAWGRDPDGAAALLAAFFLAATFLLVRRRERRRWKSEGEGVRVLRVLPPMAPSAPLAPPLQNPLPQGRETLDG